MCIFWEFWGLPSSHHCGSGPSDSHHLQPKDRRLGRMPRSEPKPFWTLEIKGSVCVKCPHHNHPSNLLCTDGEIFRTNKTWSDVPWKFTLVDIISKFILHSIPFALFYFKDIVETSFLESGGPKDWLGWSAQCKVHPFYPSHCLNTRFPSWQMTWRWIQVFQLFMHAVDVGRCSST